MLAIEVMSKTERRMKMFSKCNVLNLCIYPVSGTHPVYTVHSATPMPMNENGLTIDRNNEICDNLNACRVTISE